jgi:hypothetical protein
MHPDEGEGDDSPGLGSSNPTDYLRDASWDPAILKVLWESLKGTMRHLEKSLSYETLTIGAAPLVSGTLSLISLLRHARRLVLFKYLQTSTYPS